MSANIGIPPELESIALRTFDSLVAKGEIFYEPPVTSIDWAQGFQDHCELKTIYLPQFQCDMTSALSRKPVLPPDDPGRLKPIGPFVDPPEEWIIARIGQSHKLILNKYCVYRPMLILHTTLFAPQTDDLDVDDLTAAWAILRQMQTPQMIIYNCGVDSGSSQGHKHIQVFPRQDSEKFQMFPSKATSTKGRSFWSFRVSRIKTRTWAGILEADFLKSDVATRIPGVPFTHFVIRLPENSSARQVYAQYERLLTMTKNALKAAHAGTDYNLILVSEWIALIPRRSKGWDAFIANAANMVGSMWLRNAEQRDELLLKHPFLDMLAELGIPLRRP